MSSNRARRSVPPSYSQRLLNELDGIAASYAEVIAGSTIRYVNPNNEGGGVYFVGASNYGWGPSDAAHEAARMALLGTVRDWTTRFQLMFRHPVPTVQERLDDALGHLERWLIRDVHWDHSIPSDHERAQHVLGGVVKTLKDLMTLLPADDVAVRVLPDTNILIDNPDLAAYTSVVGAAYVVHLLPVVLRELDDLKRSGRTPELREAARRADRRLKGIRDNGDVRTGATVSGQVRAVFEFKEPRPEGLPEWLDLSVPDDQLVAAALLLQSEHPGSALYIATGDLNMQTKLAAVGLPYIEAT